MELQKNAYLCPLFLKYRAGLHLRREGFKGVFVVYAPWIAVPWVTATKIFCFQRVLIKHAQTHSGRSMEKTAQRKFSIMPSKWCIPS